jgi:predicted DNA-binding protein
MMSLSDKNTRFTIVIPKDLKEQIKELADKENRSMGNYVSYILEDHVKQMQMQIEVESNIVMEKRMSYDKELMDAALTAIYDMVNKSKKE